MLLCQDERLRPRELAAIMSPPVRVPATGKSLDVAALDEESVILLSSVPTANTPLPPLRAARDSFERAYLIEALRRAGGNVSAAAKLAGRNRTDFHDLMRKHGISASEFKG
jgi:two-component system response regulator GlrR